MQSHQALRYAGRRQVLNSALEGREYLAGPGKGTYSIADIANFCWVRPSIALPRPGTRASRGVSAL